MKLPHYTAETPMFMPVGTQGKRNTAIAAVTAAAMLLSAVKQLSKAAMVVTAGSSSLLHTKHHVAVQSQAQATG